MDSKIINDLEIYIKDYINSNDFLELVALKKTIDNKYLKEIMRFKAIESDYKEALKYPKHYDLESLKMNLSDSKAKLYEKEEVKRYLELERTINQELISLSNDLALTMSNKFKLKKIFR